MQQLSFCEAVLKLLWTLKLWTGHTCSFFEDPYPFSSTLPVASAVKLGINPSDNVPDVQLSGLKWPSAWETLTHTWLWALAVSVFLPPFLFPPPPCMSRLSFMSTNEKKEKERWPCFSRLPFLPPRISEPPQQKIRKSIHRCICMCVFFFSWPQESSHSRSEILRVTGTVSDGGTL